jgi:membrane associated rhomboid family serine protease
MFLHSGLIHLFANSISFFLYLMPVERKTRNPWLFFIVLIIGGM